MHRSNLACSLHAALPPTEAQAPVGASACTRERWGAISQAPVGNPPRKRVCFFARRAQTDGSILSSIVVSKFCIVFFVHARPHTPFLSALLPAAAVRADDARGRQRQVDELVGVLNASNITSTTEVVVAPPSVYLHGVSQKLRGDVKVRGLFYFHFSFFLHAHDLFWCESALSFAVFDGAKEAQGLVPSVAQRVKLPPGVKVTRLG